MIQADPAGLVASQLTEVGTTRIVDLETSSIEPNPHQPRQFIRQETLQELAASIKSTGVIQPIIVRPMGGGLNRYQIVAGERRWRAAREAGLDRLPAIVREIPDSDVLETALIENIQREELNPIEEARAYQTLQRERGWSQEELANKVGKQRSTVANTIRLLNLPKGIQARVESGEISMGHARALLGVLDPVLQEKLCLIIVNKELNVRQSEEIVAREVAQGDPARTRASKADPNVVAAQERLASLLGTKVRIFRSSSGSGKIIIHYYSDEELDRHFETLRRGAENDRAPEKIQRKSAGSKAMNREI
jgi:ParB family chromosome partitioning protein